MEEKSALFLPLDFLHDTRVLQYEMEAIAKATMRVRAHACACVRMLEKPREMKI